MAGIGAALAAVKPVWDTMTTAAPLVGKVAGGVLGGPVGAAAGGTLGHFLAGRYSKPGRALEEQQTKDINALRQGKLGLAEAEKRTMLAGAARNLQAQTAGIEANLRRQAAAQGGFGQSGAQQRAIGQLAGQRAEGMTQAGARVEQISQQAAENRFKDIMGRLGERRREYTQLGREAGQAGAQLPAETAVAKMKVDLMEKAKNGDEAAIRTLAMMKAEEREAAKRATQNTGGE